MKTLLALLILLCTIAVPALAELTDADLNKIRLIVNEEVTKELAPIKTDIAQLDDRLRNVEIAVGSLTGRIDGVEKQVSHTTNVTYGLIALIVVAIGIPAWRGKRDRDQERKNRSTHTRNRNTQADRKPLTNTVFGKACTDATPPEQP